MRRRIPVALVGGLVLFAALGGLVGRAGAAGVTTHTWMAMQAVPRVTDPDLQALLQANALQLQSGAHFPDSGYAPGLTYGEEAHWPRFSYAYARQIRRDPSCGDLRAARGPCAARIALLFGAVAHGIGDEVWDWLFEPNAADRGEDDEVAGLDAVGIEGKMDTIAIGDHRRSTSPTDLPAWPATSRLVGVFASIGRTDVTRTQLSAGNAAIGVVRAVEPRMTAQYHDQVTARMPWMAAHMVTAPGGVRFAAKAIAANWDDLWDFLLRRQGPARVAVTFPTDGETGIPFRGWSGGSFGAGPHAGRARTRITAVLSTTLSYRADLDEPSSIVNELDPATMTLTDLVTGEPVAPLTGFPARVPYGADPGGHVIDFQPATDLSPCTDYRVDVTNALLDARGEPVTPASWTFRTRGCPDEPAQPDAQVRVGALGAWTGWDVVDAGGDGQQVDTATSAGSPTTFTLRVQNGGPETDSFLVQGQGSLPGLRVRYIDGGGDVTAAVVAGTYRTDPLAPGGRASIEARVTLADQGASGRRTVTAASVADPTRIDAVRFAARVGATEALPAEGPVSEAELQQVAGTLVCALG